VEGKMQKPEIFRRLFHMTAVVYLVYYLIPEEISFGFYKWHGVLIIVFAALIAEMLRLRRAKLVFGMRYYEERRVSAYVWFALGMGIALLIFEMKYVVPVVIGMATIDPLIGEVRKRKKQLYPVLPSILYALIMFLSLLILTGMSFTWLLLFTVIGTVSAIAAEQWDLEYVDDDFLMLIIPLITLTMFDYLIFVNLA
jgi:hypothetical protein